MGNDDRAKALGEYYERENARREASRSDRLLAMQQLERYEPGQGEEFARLWGGREGGRLLIDQSGEKAIRNAARCTDVFGAMLPTLNAIEVYAHSPEGLTDERLARFDSIGRAIGYDAVAGHLISRLERLLTNQGSMDKTARGIADVIGYLAQRGVDPQIKIKLQYIKDRRG